MVIVIQREINVFDPSNSPLVTKPTVAFIRGLQGAGDEQFDESQMIVTVKHFVGYPENRRVINSGFRDMSERHLRVESKLF